MRPKEHPHNRAVQLVNDEMDKVVASFREDPKFMEQPVSRRTLARREAIANAPEEIKKLLAEGYTQDFVHRLAKLMET